MFEYCDWRERFIFAWNCLEQSSVGSREYPAICMKYWHAITCNILSPDARRTGCQRKPFAMHSTSQRCKHSSVMHNTSNIFQCFVVSLGVLMQRQKIRYSCLWYLNGKSDRCNSIFDSERAPATIVSRVLNKSTLWRPKCALRYAKTPKDRTDGLAKTHHSCSEQ